MNLEDNNRISVYNLSTGYKQCAYNVSTGREVILNAIIILDTTVTHKFVRFFLKCIIYQCLCYRIC